MIHLIVVVSSSTITSGSASTKASHSSQGECCPAAAKSGTPPAASISSGTQFPAEYKHNIFIAEHGSWNRSKKLGFDVVAVTADADVTLFHEPDERYWVGADFTRSDRSSIYGGVHLYVLRP